MATVTQPFDFQDFSRGRYTRQAVNHGLLPLNSASDCLNVDFDYRVGAVTSRLGREYVGDLMAGTNAVMAEFTTGDNSDQSIFDVNWKGQTFTQAGAVTKMDSVAVKIQRNGSPSGLATLSLYATSGGLPTGSPLASYIFKSSLISNTAGGTVYSFPMGTVTLTAGGVYALVLSLSGGDAGNCLYWRANNAGGYSGGTFVYSSDSGSSWAADAGQDLYFRVFSVATNAGNEPPQGFGEFKPQTGDDVLLAIYEPIGVETLYYYTDTNGTWKPTYNTVTLFPNYGLRNRFATLGNRVFIATGGQMYSSGNGIEWDTTNCITTDGVQPSLLIRARNRLLASGFTTYASRIYFSSIIDPAGSPTLTWSTDPSVGDWIDINPDDGDSITALATTSTLVVVFKAKYMYRLDVIAKSADIDEVFNFGAPYQEAVATCQGVVYFYTGTDIRRTNGGYPEQISRFGVQDILDAMDSNNKNQVCAWTDGLNVYFSLGNISLPATDDRQPMTNIVLKFSTRDESWSVYSYPNAQIRRALYRLSDGFAYGLDSSGRANKLNSGYDDASTAISGYFQTQEIDFGNRSHRKRLSDKLVVYAEDGGQSSFAVIQPNQQSQELIGALSNRVNVSRDLNLEGNYFMFRWTFSNIRSRSIFGGFYLENVTDEGISYADTE